MKTTRLLNQYSHIFLSGILALNLSACGGGGGNGSPGAGAPSNTSSAQLSQAEKNLKVGMTGGAFLDNTVVSSINLLTEAAFFLNRLGVDGVGTIQQTSTSFSYSATPNDRLRILLNGGVQVDYIISLIRGDFGFDTNFFLLNEHQMEYQVVVADVMDLSVVMSRVPNTSISKTTVSGSVKTSDFDLQVNETIDFVSGQTIFVTNESDNNWTVDGSQYSFDGSIRRAFKCGRPSNIETDWTANGNLSEDGIQIGQLAIDIDNSNNLLNVIANQQSGSIALESYRLSSGGSSTFDRTPFGTVGGDDQFIYFSSGDSQ